MRLKTFFCSYILLAWSPKRIHKFTTICSLSCMQFICELSTFSGGFLQFDAKFGCSWMSQFLEESWKQPVAHLHVFNQQSLLILQIFTTGSYFLEVNSQTREERKNFCIHFVLLAVAELHSDYLRNAIYIFDCLIRNCFLNQTKKNFCRLNLFVFVYHLKSQFLIAKRNEVTLRGSSL